MSGERSNEILTELSFAIPGVRHARDGTGLPGTACNGCRTFSAGSDSTFSVVRAKLDSYMLLLGINSTHGTNSSLYQKLSEDSVRDFVSIANPGVLDRILVVTQDLPVHSTPKMVADGRAHPN